MTSRNGQPSTTWGGFRAFRRVGWLPVLVAVLAANASSSDPYWIENAELLAQRRPAVEGNAGAVSVAEPPAEVYDSADYQFLLLTTPDWDLALILDLATTEVMAYPRSAVAGPEHQLVAPEPAQGRRVTTFLAHEDGSITFADASHTYSVEPMPPLVGEISREELASRLPTYERRAGTYRPDSAMVAELAGVGTDVEIVAFFGSWCQICKHHLPALLSTVDHCGNPHLSVTLVALDEEITEPAEWIVNYGVGYYTPTFVVCADRKEIGRIEEEPEISIEADLVHILREGAVR